MKISSKQHVLRWVMIVISFLIISLILWNTYRFFQKFKEEERIKMENFSQAQIELGKVIDLNGNISDFPLKIIQSNTTTPMIIKTSEGRFQSKNIQQLLNNNQEYLKNLSLKFSNENTPIEIMYEGKILSTIYYGNSDLLNKLKYYPFALVLIILLFSGVVYFFYKSSRNASQNKLWTGMAKETAHQIGTPLSSLIGWTELLKTEAVNPSYVTEIEKDIHRLEIITERFSKIGSTPLLKPTNIVKATEESFDYLESRSSKLIVFKMNAPQGEILVDLNPELYSWTIENLVKNGIDAMKGEGHIELFIQATDSKVSIDISDTGKGLSKKLFNRVFETGYTSKKRGWGLGLSLSKRIIEEYHKGRIKVLHSEVGEGTTMRISLKRLQERADFFG
ncbi:MAG: HAMP domain-containing sensor histidine kinase [Flavobacteriaceae bacterium]|jgi:two-component system, sporulation sensor kinase D|nr:HAMP domain-containing histidine kinase [Flavobacteriaceae bacterium]MDA7727908.1 HAMP domain-containing histidine kinase [Flavobacteriaceae bacterium]MDG1309694.1 HAMP domain-containing sensor histidine kinase [Flavobacteriaceae bacterium]